ncbi:MAG: lysophospholipid acyltransferase family protein [Phycisphaerales bacterium]
MTDQPAHLHPPEPPFIPAKPSPRFFRFFAAYTRRLIRKRFNALRITSETAPLLERAAELPAPLLIALTHSAWWDPLIAVALHDRFTPHRRPLAPMEHEQLAKFRFMTRLGMFGIDPDHPAAIDTTTAYLLEHLAGTHNDHSNTRNDAALWITPQGQFADPRAPIRLRPGLAALAARLPTTPTLITIALEYPFWTEQRPEVLVHAASTDPPQTNTTTAWHRAITASMQSSSAHLAQRAIQRDPANFITLPLTRPSRSTNSESTATTTRINPIYDLWLRLRGHDPGIKAKRR